MLEGTAPRQDFPRRVGELVLGAAAVGLLLLVAARSAAEPGGPGRTLFALGFLVLAGIVGGKFAALFRLPRLTGYLAVGVVFGPDVLGTVGHGEVKALEFVNALALALIALQAGAELTAEMFRNAWRSLAWASVTQLAVVVPGMTAAFWLARDGLPFLADVPWPAVLALAVTWAAISVSKSPAATLAVIGETHARGPLTTYAVAMVVVFDVLVLGVFSVALTFARVLVDGGTTFSADDLAALGKELVASVAAGTTLGLLIAMWLRLVKGDQGLFVVALAYGVTAFCRYFHYDTLLVFVGAGFVVRNISRQGPVLVSVVDRMGATVMVVFFATAGAHLDVDILLSGWKMALAMAAARVGLTLAACRLGHRLARDPETVTRFGWTSLVSQAGVTIGLVALAAERLPPPLGAGLAALGIAVVALNELVGPVLFKAALSRAGETGQAAAAPPHG